MNHFPAKLLIIALIVLAARRALGSSRKKGQYGDKCDANDFNGCDPGLAVACLSSTCACIYPWMLYDSDKNKCLSSVSQQCDLDIDVKFLECVPNAHCVNLPNEYGEPFPQCVCDANYSPVTKRTCSDPEPDYISLEDKIPKICCSDNASSST